MWFRRKMSMVSQEPSLFACSIKENIAYGRDTTDEEVCTAAVLNSSFAIGGCFVTGTPNFLRSGANFNALLSREICYSWKLTTSQIA